MFYYKSKTGKFPHMMIEKLERRSDYLEKTKWINSNIGSYRIEWISSIGLTDGKQKIYLRDNRYNKELRLGEGTHNGRQWCFRSESQAMAFKLRWHTKP